MYKKLLSPIRAGIWVVMLLASSVAWAQISITPSSLTYTQDFNSLANTGTANTWTNNSTLPGWLSTQTTYRAGTGSDNAGALYSFGVSGATERALGSVASGSATPQYGILLTNNTGAPIASFQVSYTGEQWRNGGNTSTQKLAFSYVTGSNLTIASTGIDYTQLDFTSPVATSVAAALDGNQAANQSAVSATLTLNTPLADGQQILLKWSDANDPGNDHGLAIDNLTIVANANTDPNAPKLLASPTTLSGFSTAQGTASGEQNYTLTTANLSSPVSVSAPAGIEISLTSGSGFGSSLSIPASANSSVVFVRLAGATAGTVNGTITNNSGNLSANITVSGVVNSSSPITSIATARASIGQTVTIQGRVTVTNQLGSRQIFVQDETGGIAVYSGATGTDLTTQVQLGDLVQARGPISVFNGYLEVNGVTGFTVVSGAGTVNPTPVTVTPDQLANYQGQLVTVTNATITPTGSNFTGGSNYTLTAGGQTTTLRISANSPLAGAGQPANPVTVTGIADRFVSGATTTGTNGLQLQPRILSDIPGSSAPQDLTCTISGNSSLNRDQTLDIAAWNMEFFGANAGTISCPNGNLVYNNMGPVNDDLQQTNAVTVLSKLSADIISVEEVSDINRFDAVVKALPGSYNYVCSNRFSYYFQNECDQVPSGGTVFGPTSLAQKVCVIYNTATVTPVLAETKPLLDGKYAYPNDNGWSSGRLPFLFVADATINGVTKRIHVVAIHAKSGSALEDYNRRKQDVADLKALLDSSYPNANLIILGDYNDKLNGSIASGQVSSYQPLLSDPGSYIPLTLPLENQGCSTFNSSASFIDHMIVSNELQPAYVANSTYVLQPFSIPNYGNTTSDHNPIESRFDLSQLTSPTSPTNTTGFAITAVTTVSCATVTASQRTLTFNPQYAGLNGQPVSFSIVNEMLPTTNAGPYTMTVYTDNPTLNLRAVQSGSTASFAYNWLPACTSGVSSTTSTPTSPTNTTGFAITAVTTVSCATVTASQRTLTFNPQYAGLNGQPVSFSIVNEMLPTTNAGPYTMTVYTDNPTLNLRAVQSGATTGFAYNWLPACTSGASSTTSTPTSPTNTTGFAITAVTTVSCATVTASQRTLTFNPRYAGLNGQPVSFSIVNEMLPTTNAGPYTMTVYTDNPTLNLRAVQSGVTASFAYNWLASCTAGSNARVGVEPGTAFSATLFPNPVRDEFTVGIKGAQGKTVQLQLTDVNGRSITNTSVEVSTPDHKETLRLTQRPAGLYLLRVSIPQQTIMLKVIKQ
jgi:hypothetical protein